MKFNQRSKENIDLILLTIVFYIENNIFKIKTKNTKFVLSLYIFSSYLIIQSIYKLTKEFDIFNLIYLIIGIIMLIYSIRETFITSFRKHRELKNFGYKSISELYKGR